MQRIRPPAHKQDRSDASGDSGSLRTLDGGSIGSAEKQKAQMGEAYQQMETCMQAHLQNVPPLTAP